MDYFIKLYNEKILVSLGSCFASIVPDFTLETNILIPGFISFEECNTFINLINQIRNNFYFKYRLRQHLPYKRQEALSSIFSSIGFSFSKKLEFSKDYEENIIFRLFETENHNPGTLIIKEDTFSVRNLNNEIVLSGKFISENRFSSYDLQRILEDIKVEV